MNSRGNTMRTTILLTLALATVAACGNDKAGMAKAKEASCNNVCADIRKEDEQACTDDACKQDAKAKFESCQSLCKTMANADKPPMSQEDEAKKAEADCAKNDAEACATLGGAYLLGKGGMPKDEAKGAELTKKSCEMGSAFGCELYGRAAEKGMGMPPDRKLA